MAARVWEMTMTSFWRIAPGPLMSESLAGHVVTSKLDPIPDQLMRLEAKSSRCSTLRIGSFRYPLGELASGGILVWRLQLTVGP